MKTLMTFLLSLLLITSNSTHVFAADKKESVEEKTKSEKPATEEKVNIKKYTQEPGSETQIFNLGDGRKVAYEKPEFWHMVTEVPNTSWYSLKRAFTKDKFWPWMLMLSSTALLVKYDSEIFEEAQRQGRDLGIGNEENTKTVLEVGDINLIRLPTDLGSTLYFIGDGWTHFGIAGAFLYYGHKHKDYRAWNTSYQLVHGMTVSTLFNQFLKRATGRETPGRRTEPTGRWRPFPSIEAYNTRTAEYDAVPSGHVMTSTLVMTIINQNYPEYSHITLPVGWTLITLLGWQMVNNGVHWASDYPIAIGMGHFYGKLVTNTWKFRKELTPKNASLYDKIRFQPLMREATLGVQANYEF